MRPSATLSFCVEQLEVTLLNRSGRQVRDFSVIVRAEGLILRGRATTYYAKQLAQHAALELTGLPVRENAALRVF